VNNTFSLKLPPIEYFYWGSLEKMCIFRPNNTPQAYPAVRCREAQTGGLIVSGACDAL
jgi:hypothetical protein